MNDLRKMIRSGQLKAANISIDGNAIRSDGRKHTKPPLDDAAKAKRRAANKRARKARRS